jgi:hypothetical protein
MKQQHKKILTEALAGRDEILFAVLYGTAAEGLAFRDLDIGIFVDRKKVPSEKDLAYGSGLSDDLAPLFSCPVDLRVINDAPILFRRSVSCGIPLVVNDEEVFFSFLTRTWSDFLDFQPVAMK